MMNAQAFPNNPVLRDTGAQYPIFQAPMTWIASAQLSGAVSAAGGFGLLETSSALEKVRGEFDRARAMSDRPFGLNLAIKFLRHDADHEEAVLRWALDGRVRLVTTSAGDPRRYVQRIRDAGVKVYHAVPSLEGALKAEDAGVDGLVVEGGESGGIRGRDPVHAMVLLQAVRARTSLPIVAAGGIVDGRGMAAAFALGADAVAMGTRFVASAESPVHMAYKQAIVDARPDGTIAVPNGPTAISRVLRTPLAEQIAAGEVPLGPPTNLIQKLYVEGRLDEAVGSAGETAGLITSIKPVRDIIEDTMAGFWREIDRLAQLRGGAPA